MTASTIRGQCSQGSGHNIGRSLDNRATLNGTICTWLGNHTTRVGLSMDTIPDWVPSRMLCGSGRMVMVYSSPLYALLWALISHVGLHAVAVYPSVLMWHLLRVYSVRCCLMPRGIRTPGIWDVYSLLAV